MIAGLAVTAGIEPSLGPLTARCTEPLATRLLVQRRQRSAPPSQEKPPAPPDTYETIDDQDAVGHA